MKTLTFVALGLIMATQNLLACMAAPQEIVWYKPKGKPYHYSVTVKGVVTIVSAKDNKKVLWKATLASHVQYADMIHVVDDGNRIVSIHGNSRVNKLTDVAIEAITKDGKKSTFTAKEFIGDLQPGTPPGQPRMSIAPKFRWMKSVKKVDGKGIEIINALGKTKTVSWG